jgi:spore maturation protein CgeB
MDVLQRNLEALRARNPDLASRIATIAHSGEVSFEPAQSGAATFRVRGRLEASAADPEDEGRSHAQRFLARAEETGATRLVLFGLGVHTLRHLTPFSGSVLVVEPCLELCRAVLERVDLSEALARVELLSADSPEEVVGHEVFRSRERGALVFHPAARRRSPELFDRLCRRFHPGGTPARLRIAVIPPLHGGSLPIAHACTRALREIGHDVIDVDLEPFLPAYRAIHSPAQPLPPERRKVLAEGLVRLTGEVVMALLDEAEPDVAFALAQAPLDPPVLERIRAAGIATAFWFCEDFRVMPYWADLVRHYDTVFHIQPGSFEEPLREAGAYGVPLAMGFDPAVHRPVDLTAEEKARYACDLSFVGAGYRNRRESLPALLDLGLRLYGTEWPEHTPLYSSMPEPNTRQSAEDSNRIFNASRINLNLHSSPWCDGVNPAGDYLNPRTFELAGARAFQLVDERRELPFHFQAGIEVETFADIQECRKKALYYLDREDERREIAENAYQRAMREHTYRHRMEEAAEQLRSGPEPVVPRRRSYQTVAEVIESAREEPELAEILARVPGETRWDLDALSGAVGKGNGELSQEEMVLLFMREYEREVRAYAVRKAAQ